MSSDLNDMSNELGRLTAELKKYPAFAQHSGEAPEAAVARRIVYDETKRMKEGAHRALRRTFEQRLDDELQRSKKLLEKAERDRNQKNDHPAHLHSRLEETFQTLDKAVSELDKLKKTIGKHDYP